MRRFLIAIGVIIIACQAAYAQPELDLKPNKIEFKDTFNRLQHIYFINKGDQVLKIDTIYYRSDLYLVRFDEYWRYPFKILPGDTVLMDCILSGYLNVASTDTVDTMYVVSDSKNGTEYIKVKIDFYDDDYESVINGQVTDGTDPVAGAKVYFLYEGSYIISSAFTDAYGSYSAVLPRGRYSIAAAKDPYITTFFGQKPSPFTAKLITIQDDNPRTANIVLTKITHTGNKISGKVTDSLTSSIMKKAILVIRKGNHTPRKINSPVIDEENTSTVFVNPDGTYSAEIGSPGYYFVQSFSDYYLPSYYSSDEYSSVFWQQADSVYISSLVTNKNIFLPRDSSYGAGIIEGKIIIDGYPPDSLSEILVFAQSVVNNFIYSYSFSKEEGKFKITNLPYGEYKLFAQKIGYDNFYSETIKITPQAFKVNNVEIYASLSAIDEKDFVPGGIEIYPNYPNPFNPSTTIEFFIPSEIPLSLSVFNAIGEEVKLLFQGTLQRGSYKFAFNGDGLSSGTYFVSLKTPDKIQVRKVLLFKVKYLSYIFKHTKSFM